MAIDPHPVAPAAQNLIGKLDLRLVELSQNWYRIHASSDGPLHFAKKAEYRFDDPQRKFGVLYLSADFSGAFIETMGRTLGVRLLREDYLVTRAVTIVKAQRLLLVDLASEGASHAGVDGRLCTADYRLTQPWARAFHQHPARPDGILFRARHDLSCLCAAIFDRAKSKVKVERTIGLISLAGQKLIAPVMSKYHYGLSCSTSKSERARRT